MERRFIVGILLANLLIGGVMAVLIATRPAMQDAVLGVGAIALALLDAPLFLWAFSHARSRQGRSPLKPEKTFSQPELARLHELHWRFGWLASLAFAIDVFASFGVILALLWLAVTYSPLLVWLQDLALASDGQDALEATFLPACVAGAILYMLVIPKLFRTTLGLHVTRLVALDPATGKPLGPSKFEYPSGHDYRRDRLPMVLFVPRDQLPPDVVGSV